MKIILSLLLITFFTFSHAQSSYNVIDFETEKAKSVGSSVVGVDKDGYIYTTSIKYTYIVIGKLMRVYLKVFNAKSGEMVAEVQLEKSKELRGRGMEYITIDFIDNKPTIICEKSKSEIPKKFYGIHIDRNGRLEGTAFEIGKSGECSGFMNRKNNSYSKLYHQEMKQGTLTFISSITCKGDELSSYRVLELNKDQEVENTYTFGLNYESVSSLSFTESGDNLYLKADTDEKEKVDGKLFKRNVTTHRLFKISRKDGSITEIQIENNFLPLKVGDFMLKPVSNGVLLSGQIIGEKGFIGLFTAILDEETNEIKDIQTEDFDIDFVTKYWSDKQKEKEERRRDRKGETEDDENFSTDFELMEAYETSDNGMISIYQEFDLRVVTTTSRDANGITTTDTDYYYYYKDVIIVKTREDGTIEYTKLLPFYQLTVNYDPGIGYSALRDGNDIYFMHGTSNVTAQNIEEGKKSDKKSRLRDRRINHISITHLNEKGDVDTEQVLDVKEQNVSSDPNNFAVDEKNRQFIVVSPNTKMFNTKKTKIIRIEL